MQRQEFLQQLWLDFIHLHPEIGGLRLWPVGSEPEFLALLTLNHGPFAADNLSPTLLKFGYRAVERHAMADRGLLVSLYAPPDDGPWLVLGELQLGTLTKEPRDILQALVEQTRPADTADHNLLTNGRPWPMPEWNTFCLLQRMHPLAAWLAVMGPRLHHVGFDCGRLGNDLTTLDMQLEQAGLDGNNDRHHGVFPVSPLLNYRFYPTCSQRLAFAGGDEHRVTLGGLALIQPCIPNNHDRSAQLLLPQHTRCEIA
ncbi:DUF1338 domain-containing protein [Onishia niordana]|uniref:DUF1338 domain-containing protein n=1 Tax=Onishia niordana TaxID=2508711 RepID=UPI0010A0AE95|nr:DUF1338 domain-containing protein [Halomonas niordiana]